MFCSYFYSLHNTVWEEAGTQRTDCFETSGIRPNCSEVKMSWVSGNVPASPPWLWSSSASLQKPWSCGGWGLRTKGSQAGQMLKSYSDTWNPCSAPLRNRRNIVSKQQETSSGTVCVCWWDWPLTCAENWAVCLALNTRSSLSRSQTVRSTFQESKAVGGRTSPMSAASTVEMSVTELTVECCEVGVFFVCLFFMTSFLSFTTKQTMHHTVLLRPNLNSSQAKLASADIS